MGATIFMAPPSNPQALVGTVVGGRYELFELSSATAAVWEFRAEDADGTESLVEVFPGVDASRFLDEAERLRPLSNRHLAATLSAGVDEGLACGFIVHPRLKGRRLSNYLAKEAPLDTLGAARLGLQLALGLEDAHRHGVCHRALSPEHILVTEENGELVAKLLGFGAGPEWPRKAPLKPEEAAFLAPEQAGKLPADELSDVWSLAAIVYALLTGEPPRHLPDGLSADSLLDTVAQGNVGRLQSAAPWASPQLVRVIHGALLFDRDARCPSAQSFADALRHWLGNDEPLSAALLTTVATDARAQVADVASIPQDWTAIQVGKASIEASYDPSAKPSMDFLVGSTIGGRYELVRLIGEGGMGAVFEATTPDGETVAVKLIRSEAAGEDTMRRFLREARSAMRVESPNVVRVIEASTDGKIPFIVMEMLNGRDLSETIRAVGPLDGPVAARLFVEACAGLEAAHERGLVHRDIKPANIFLHEMPDGTLVPKICDFGVAKQQSTVTQQATALTRTGGILGSPAYMSPEQANDAKSVDHRSDIWSLAASLYEALSGQPPWSQCANIGELMLALYTRNVPPIQDVAPWVGKAMALAVHGGLTRERDLRYATAADFAARLKPLAAPGPIRPSDLRGIDPEAQTMVAERASGIPSGPTGTSVDATQTGSAPERSKTSLLRWLIPAIAVVGVGVFAWRSQSSPEDMESAEPAAPACISNSACVDEVGGPAVCRASGCVALENDQCKVLAEEEVIRSDDTLWIGAMFPTQSADELVRGFGTTSVQALDLARRDFMNTTGGLPPHAGSNRTPLGIVACDDSRKPEQAAAHLAQAVGVPAVVGFRSSKDVVTLAGSVFIPNKTLIMPALNPSTQISSIPHPEGSPRLVWRTAITTAQSAPAAAKLIEEHWATELHQHGKERFRVLLLRSHDSSGVAFSDTLLKKLRFNGGSTAENRDDFLELTYSPASGSADYSVLDRIEQFGPDIVITVSIRDDVVASVLAPLELEKKIAPFYLYPGTPEGAALTSLMKKRPTLASRFLGLTPPTNTPTNNAFTSRYNAAFNATETPETSPAAPYDSFYLIAFAAAIAERPITGATLARGMERLLPPGRAIEVGPAQILTGIGELQRGNNIDLVGAYGPLDFTPSTGESDFDMSILCARVKDDTVEPMESGLTYRARVDKLEGTFSCPGM